jgi:hypothetical protein
MNAAARLAAGRVRRRATIVKTCGKILNSPFLP